MKRMPGIVTVENYQLAPTRNYVERQIPKNISYEKQRSNGRSIWTRLYRSTRLLYSTRHNLRHGRPRRFKSDGLASDGRLSFDGPLGNVTPTPIA